MLYNAKNYAYFGYNLNQTVELLLLLAEIFLSIYNYCIDRQGKTRPAFSVAGSLHPTVMLEQ